MGMPTIAPALMKFALVLVGELFRHGQNQDQLNPFGGLEMASAGHLDPAPRAQVFLAKDDYCQQRRDGNNVHPVNAVEQLLIVDKTHQKHAENSAADPIKLPDMGSGEFGVLGGTANLQHTQPANKQDEGQQQPIKIAE
jgi:hypothetical protein